MLEQSQQQLLGSTPLSERERGDARSESAKLLEACHGAWTILTTLVILFDDWVLTQHFHFCTNKV